jgi:putative transposase
MKSLHRLRDDMDFVHDQLSNGQVFRILTVIDNWSRQSVLLEVGFRLNGHSVVEAFNRVARKERLPLSITMDHGTEFTSRALDEWAWQNKVQLDFTRPGKLTDNGLSESLNGRLRDECLNVNEFQTMADAKRIIEAWRVDYNEHRPHGSLGNLTPKEFISKCQSHAESSEIPF